MDNNPPGKLVLILSKLTLSSDHMSLLSKGLSFCPTPNEPDPGQNRLDLDNLHRRLRLDYHFMWVQDDSLSDPPPTTDEINWFSTEPFSHRKFKQPSTFNPVGPPNLEAMNLSNEHAFNNRPTFRRTKWDNITPGERRALYDLKHNKDILIKAADKGNVVCVLQHEEYIFEGMRLLSL